MQIYHGQNTFLYHIKHARHKYIITNRRHYELFGKELLHTMRKRELAAARQIRLSSMARPPMHLWHVAHSDTPCIYTMSCIYGTPHAATRSSSKARPQSVGDAGCGTTDLPWTPAWVAK